MIFVYLYIIKNQYYMRKLFAELAYKLFRNEIRSKVIIEVLDGLTTEELMTIKREHNYIYNKK